MTKYRTVGTLLYHVKRVNTGAVGYKDQLFKSLVFPLQISKMMRGKGLVVKEE